MPDPEIPDHPKLRESDMEDENPVRPHTRPPFGLQLVAIRKKLPVPTDYFPYRIKRTLKSNEQPICRVKKRYCRFP